MRLTAKLCRCVLLCTLGFTVMPALASAEASIATAPPGYPITGIDVSNYQQTINWPSVAAAGARFSYAKATEGVSYTDPYFNANYSGAKANGLYAGAYHFARPDRGDGRAQADYFLDRAQYTNDGRTLPPMLDIEWPWDGSGSPYPCYGLTPAQMVTWIQQFTTRVRERTGQPTMIYTNTNWWNPCTGSNSSFGDNPLFIANYGTSPSPLPAGWTRWTLWQYASQGSLPGDQDVFNGTLNELAQLAGGATDDGSVSQGSGDVNNDGRSDAVMLYHHSDGAIGLFTSLTDSSGGFTPFNVQLTVPGAAVWDWHAFKALVSDFNGDHRADVAIMYHHSDGSITMHTSLATASGGFGSFSAASLTVPAAAVWDWNAIRLTTGDVNNDGRSDAVMLYHHGDGAIGLFTALADTSGGFAAFNAQLTVPAAAVWDWHAFKTLVSDFNGDHRADVAIMYHHSDGSITMHTSLATASGGFGSFSLPSLTVPAAAVWDWNAIRLTTGDVNNDGRSDAVMLYHHSDGAIGLFTSLADTSGGFAAFNAQLTVPAAAVWDWNAFKTITGDYNGDHRNDLAIMYHHGDGSITMHTSLATASGGFGSFSLASLTVPAAAVWDWNAIRLF